MSDLLPIELWKSAVMSPKETFAKEKKNASITDGAKQLVVGGAIGGLVAGLFTMNPVAMVGMAVMGAIVAPIAMLIGTAVMWVIAKLLGGKGAYSTQYYVTALFAAPLYPIAMIPVVGMLASLYELYLAYLMLKEVHDFDSMKAIIVLAIPLVIAIVIGMVAAAAIIAMIGAAGMAGLSGGVPGY
ncbi:MAG: Yip1 family protein [Candidatus Micrarchaeia archaeon]|jgi:hypothetical protein